MNTPIQVPEGFWENMQGAFVPESNVKDIDKLRDQTVRKIFDMAEALHNALAAFKHVGFEDIASFIQVSAGEYGVNIGGTKGNVSLFSFDGRLKIQRNIADNIRFDEKLQVAKQLIDECLEEWTADSRDEIKAIINKAFEVDRSGKISTAKILALRNIKIDHEKWNRAMDAISDSIEVIGSKAYLRFFKRNDENGEYIPMSLDIASIKPRKGKNHE